MNEHFSTALLESALAGNLPAKDEALLHRHVEACEECGAELERLAGGQAWRQEAAELLAADELDAAAPTREEWSEVDFTVEHLEPADEPGILGRLGGYDVLEIIGRGVMGVVLKGYDRELKRPVAIKVLAPHLAPSSLAKKRFAREAQAAAAVVHPHVVAIHQVQPNGRLPFLVMPLLAGESLAERLAARGALELKELLRIGMQAAAGLAAAHEQGLVHRDVKPANILLEKGVERAVLTDFGLARAADDVALTRWGIIAGTPQYMSPEQARGEPLDGRSDLFSLGCVLYEMATGVSPFRSDSLMATIRRLVDDAPRAMVSLNPELPPWFCAIVDRLLEKDSSRRFNSAQEVSDLLEGCLAHVQRPAAVPLPASLAPHAARGFRISNTPRKGAIAMMGALGFAVLGMVLWQAANGPDGNVDTGRPAEESATAPGDSDREAAAAEKPEVLSPLQVVENGRELYLSRKRIVVRFRVASVKTVEEIQENGDVHKNWDLSSEETPDFSVSISPTAQAAFRSEEAAEPPQSFIGTSIEVTGEVHGVGLDLIFRDTIWTYHIDVDSPDQVRQVVAASDDREDAAVGAEGDPVDPVEDSGTPAANAATESSAEKGAVEVLRPQLLFGVPTGENVSAIAYSADGGLIAIANGNRSFPLPDDWKRSVEILDGETGKSVLSLRLTTEEEDAVLSAIEGMPHFDVGPLAFSPDGSLLAVGTGLGQVKLFNPRTGELARSLDDPEAKRAEKVTPEALKSLARAMGGVGALAFSPDGTLLATCGSSFDDFARGWGNLERGGLERSSTGPGRLKVWEVNTGTLKHDLVGHSHANAVSFSADGNLLASAGSWGGDRDNGTGAIIWKTQTGEKISVIITEANMGTHAVVFSPTNKLVAIGSRQYDKENDTYTTAVSVAYALSGITEWRRTIPGWAKPAAFSPDGRSIAVLCGRQSVRLIDRETGQDQHEIRVSDTPHEGQWNDLAIALGANRMVIGGSGGERRGFLDVWNLAAPPAE